MTPASASPPTPSGRDHRACDVRCDLNVGPATPSLARGGRGSTRRSGERVRGAFDVAASGMDVTLRMRETHARAARTTKQ